MIVPKAIIYRASSSGSCSILWEKRYLWKWEGSYHRGAVAGAPTPAHPASSAQSTVPAATTVESFGLMPVIAAAQPILPGFSWRPFSQWCDEKVSLPCLLLLLLSS